MEVIQVSLSTLEASQILSTNTHMYMLACVLIPSFAHPSILAISAFYAPAAELIYAPFYPVVHIEIYCLVSSTHRKNLDMFCEF